MSTTWFLVEGEWTPELRDAVTRWGFEISDDPQRANIHLSVRINSTGLSSASGVSARNLDERFQLQVSDWAPLIIDLTAAHDRGVRAGFNAIRRGLRLGEWPDATTQYAKFSQRGVLEGFYGPPWTHAERLDMVEFLADHDFNLFVLAPKDEASQRWDWRSQLSNNDREQITHIAAKARANAIDIMCCVSPGLSIRYSDPVDRQLLVDRMLQFHRCGVTRVGLLLDDIPNELQFDEDRRAYGSIAQAHGDLASHLAQQLWAIDPEFELAICPLVYHGMGDEPYLLELGRSLHPRIDLFWTGREICSHRLDLMDAAVFTRSTLRPPLYWDNYPVNDAAMVGELHIGPYQGRDRHLYRLSAGIAANASDKAETSKISFATIGDYLRDPEGYDADASWRNAIAEIAGEDAQAYARFAENAQWSCLAIDDAPTLGSVVNSAWLEFGKGDLPAGCAMLMDFADQIDGTSEYLLRDNPANSRLIEQSRPWIEQYARGAAALRQIAALISGGISPDVARTVLRPLTHQAAFADHPRVFADTLSMFIDDVLAQDWSAPSKE